MRIPDGDDVTDIAGRKSRAKLDLDYEDYMRGSGHEGLRRVYFHAMFLLSNSFWICSRPLKFFAAHCGYPRLLDVLTGKCCPSLLDI